jgi:CMP-N-acetylneuraminic acid synthetase
VKTIALLPMKVNSERVKGKNFKVLAGKPLFKWILESLLQVPEIDEIIINTDARHILEDNGIRSDGRVKIRDRQPDLCGDHVSMNLIIQDDLGATDGDRYIMTHTTNPLLSPTTISSGLNDYDRAVKLNKADSLFGVTRCQTRFYQGDGTPINHDPDNLIRTQDLEPWYEENSCIYIFSKLSFSKTGARIGAKPILFEIPKLEAIDIDEKEDWFLASVIAKGLSEEENYV